MIRSKYKYSFVVRYETVSTDFKTSGWEQVALAIEDVGDRLRRATLALAAGSIPYAVTGGNAVAEWVGRIDRAAVR